ncbi:MAG TPA: FHA domain-containing protein, partial [Thermoanaerobaculia bacterium]|nr:FHA domain-containing protein [Thermoanaerobaculia bacterium]
MAGSPVRLGRGNDNDIMLSDVSVSRHHAELRRGPEGWSIHDLNSTNGVEVNRVPVKTAPLEAGDRLGIGVFELWFEALPQLAPTLPTVARTVAPDEGFASLANATIIRPLADFAADYGLSGQLQGLRKSVGTTTATTAATAATAGTSSPPAGATPLPST